MNHEIAGDEMTKLLFICSGNRDRSPTAENIYKAHPGFAVRSAGTSLYANTRVSKELLLWADAIVVMEPGHESFLREHHTGEVENKPIFQLGLPDEYRYMEDALVELIREKMAPILPLLEKLGLLQEDIDHIRGVLANAAACDAYDFAVDIRGRMKARGLSRNTLAQRCGLAAAAVGNWLDGRARPNGKEQMKELGLALGMNEEELSDFLLKNRYTRLYSKNPLDVACKRVLREHAGDGDADLVRLYQAKLDKHNIVSLPLPEERVSISTTFLSTSVKTIASDDDFSAWLENNAKHFDADDKKVLPTRSLRHVILLYVGYRSMLDMRDGDELPEPLYRLLPSIGSGKEYALRGLREKLIVFGLYSNMTDTDIDLMLGHARLMPLTKSATGDGPKSANRIDAAIAAALRRAHERCPCCEYMAIEQVIDNIVGFLANRKLRGQAFLAVCEQLLAEYRERLDLLKRKDPFGMPRSKDEQRFEDWYGDHLSSYVRDVLRLLVSYGNLTESEIATYVKLISNAKELSWSLTPMNSFSGSATT